MPILRGLPGGRDYRPTRLVVAASAACQASSSTVNSPTAAPGTVPTKRPCPGELRTGTTSGGWRPCSRQPDRGSRGELGAWNGRAISAAGRVISARAKCAGKIGRGCPNPGVNFAGRANRLGSIAAEAAKLSPLPASSTRRIQRRNLGRKRLGVAVAMSPN